MKALLISIRPQWVELILNFIKKDEIRKGTAIGKAINKLIEEQGVAPTFIYCTKDTKYHCFKNNSFNFNKYAAIPIPFNKEWYKSMKHIQLLNGKVVARFNATAEEIVTVNRLDTGKVVLYRGHKNGITNRKLMEGSCLTFDEMNNYLQGKIGTDIHINDLEIFNKPKELSEFKSYKKNIVNTKINGMVFETELDNSLIKAPQSWCYVEI